MEKDATIWIKRIIVQCYLRRAYARDAHSKPEMSYFQPPDMLCKHRTCVFEQIYVKRGYRAMTSSRGPDSQGVRKTRKEKAGAYTTSATI